MLPDITVMDRDERDQVLVAKVQPTTTDDADVVEFLAQLKASDPPIPFGMLVDPDHIRVLDAGREGLSAQVLSFPTVDVFRHYSEDFAGSATPHWGNKVFRYYLTGLAEAWLADLARRWKPGEPPKAGQLAEAGVLPRIEGGFTIERDLIGGDRLP